VGTLLFTGTLQDLMELHGIPWNLMESHGSLLGADPEGSCQK
jgi:hypothetical protein